MREKLCVLRQHAFSVEYPGLDWSRTCFQRIVKLLCYHFPDCAESHKVVLLPNRYGDASVSCFVVGLIYLERLKVNGDPCVQTSAHSQPSLHIIALMYNPRVYILLYSCTICYVPDNIIQYYNILRPRQYYTVPAGLPDPRVLQLGGRRRGVWPMAA